MYPDVQIFIVQMEVPVPDMKTIASPVNAIQTSKETGANLVRVKIQYQYQLHVGGCKVDPTKHFNVALIDATGPSPPDLLIVIISVQLIA